MRKQIFATAAAALFAASAADAAIYTFDFVSTKSQQVGGFGDPMVDGQEGIMRARLVLDLPNLVNIYRNSAWNYDNVPALWFLGGSVDGMDLLFPGVGSSLSFTTRGDGSLQFMTLKFHNDYPDYLFGLGSASWGDASETFYAAEGSWTITSSPEPELPPVPLPAGVWLLGTALAGLGAARLRRRT